MLADDALEARVRSITTLSARSSEESSRYVKELYEFASSLSAKDFPRVLALLQKPGDKKQQKLRQELLAYWMEQNAAAARAHINAVSPKERQQLMVAGQGTNPLVHAWASADPTGLMTWLKNLPARERQAIRDSVLPSVARTLAQRDPNAAFDFMLESPDSESGGRGAVERAIFSEWGRQDPAAAAEGALKTKAGSSRWIALHESVSPWLKTDEEAVMTWVRGITDPQLALEATVIIADKLASERPETALTLLIEQAITSDTNTFAVSVRAEACRAWMKQDPSRALDWAHQLEAGAMRDAVFATMLPTLAKEQPQRAADLFLAETARGSSLGNSAGEIVQGLIKTGAPGSVISFLGQLQEREQMRATDTVPFYLLHNNVSPTGIIDIGQQLPPGAVRNKWLSESAKYIIRERGTLEMQRVLEQLPAGADRDALVSRSIVEILRFKADPETAVALSQTLGNGHQYLTEGIAAWLGTSNPTPARKWLQETRLFTPEEKQQLFQPPSHPSNVSSARTGTSTSTGIPRP